MAGVPAKDWKLSAEGFRQSECLAERLRDAGLEQVITGFEPKAHQTVRILAERLSISFSSAPHLHEHRRESTEFIGEHARWEEMVREFFASPDQLIFGEETADEAHRRFSRAVMDQIRGNIAIVAHGTVISLLVAAANGLDRAVEAARLTFGAPGGVAGLEAGAGARAGVTPV